MKNNIELPSISGESVDVDPDLLSFDALSKRLVEREATKGRLLDMVTDAQSDVQAALASLNERVGLARLAGASWSEIGRAVGITHSAAHRRWNPDAKKQQAEYQRTRIIRNSDKDSVVKS